MNNEGTGTGYHKMIEHGKKPGNIVFLAALGMMAGLVAIDMRDLTSWNEVFTPIFIADLLAHFGTVVGAYVAGRLIPKNGGV